MKRRSDFDWNDEAVATLRCMHAEGAPYSEVGNKLGISRNAAIGKAKRIGLARRDKKTGAITDHAVNGIHRKRKRRPKSDRPNKQNIIRKPRIVSCGSSMTIIEAVEMAEPIDSDLSPDAIPMAQRKTLLQLGDDDCRWPYGDPLSGNFFFCGGEQDIASSYCLLHRLVAMGRSLNISPEEFERRRLLGLRQTARRMAAA